MNPFFTCAQEDINTFLKQDRHDVEKNMNDTVKYLRIWMKTAIMNNIFVLNKIKMTGTTIHLKSRPFKDHKT